MEAANNTVITFFGTLITSVISWMGNVVSFIADQPLILVPMMTFFIAGGVIGLVNRLIRG